jgi:type IV pilus assembly protein PilF
MINNSLPLLQGLLKKKRARFFYYSQLSIVLCGLSGCHSPILSQDTTTAGAAHQTAEYNLQLGLAYLKAGDRIQAKTKLLKAEQQNPTEGQIKSAIAYFLEHIGELGKAEAYHLQALKLDQNNSASHNNYGRFLCQCGRYNEAEIHFLKAIQNIHYLNTASAYENLGLCAMRIPDNIKAIRYLKAALQHNPQLEKSLLALAQLYLKQPKLAYAYLQRYHSVAGQSNPTALALGVELAWSLEDKKSAYLYAYILKQKYPHSRECQQVSVTYPDLIDPQ